MFVIPVSATGIGIFMWFIIGGFFADKYPEATQRVFDIVFNIIGLTFWGIVGLFAITCIVWIVGVVLWLFPSKTPKQLPKS